jgi:hypothetical protein
MRRFVIPGARRLPGLRFYSAFFVAFFAVFFATFFAVFFVAFFAIRTGDAGAVRAARRRVNAAKVALGERGPPWWDDGAPGYNRHLVKSTPYRAWFEAQDPPDL